MININDRPGGLIDKANEKELYFLIRLARFMNKNRQCFPGNKTLMKITGWSLPTLLNTRKGCVKKGLLYEFARLRPDGTRTTNGYQILTTDISVFVNLSGAGDENPNQSEKTEGKEILPRTKNNSGGGVKKSYPNEVLATNEVLGLFINQKDKKKTEEPEGRIKHPESAAKLPPGEWERRELIRMSNMFLKKYPENRKNWAAALMKKGLTLAGKVEEYANYYQNDIRILTDFERLFNKTFGTFVTNSKPELKHNGKQNQSSGQSNGPKAGAVITDETGKRAASIVNSYREARNGNIG